jgi:hypothetical protein
VHVHGAAVYDAADARCPGRLDQGPDAFDVDGGVLRRRNGGLPGDAGEVVHRRR